MRDTQKTPPVWLEEELKRDLNEAIRLFRKERIEEPLELYLQLFEQFQGAFEDLLEQTVDLSKLEENALEILSKKDSLDAFRYLAGPPISLDDLMVLSNTNSLSLKQLQSDPDLVKRVVGTVLQGLDRRRFNWVSDGNRDPTETERAAAVIASAALVAAQRTATVRRNSVRKAQEQSVRDSLLFADFKEVKTRRIKAFTNAPGPGEFCMETLFGERKADLVVGLWDHRVMLIECKVSNSSTNSIKRLNNDVAAKASVWRRDFGERMVVPTALVSGVYKLKNLIDAQEKGLTLFWAHDLPTMIEWINGTKKQEL
jgi:hypothetical protein